MNVEILYYYTDNQISKDIPDVRKWLITEVLSGRLHGLVASVVADGVRVMQNGELTDYGLGVIGRFWISIPRTPKELRQMYGPFLSEAAAKEFSDAYNFPKHAQVVREYPKRRDKTFFVRPS